MSTLAACRTCGHQVAPSAKACPSCGQSRPAADPQAQPEWLTLLLALLFAGVVISVLAAVM